MPKTLVPNNPATTLQPTGPSNGTSLNPVFTTVDPINGNYFTASGRDMVQLYCSPAVLAPTWSSLLSYTIGQVVTLSGVQYIAIASSLNQTPPNSLFWAIYAQSTVNILSAPDACTGRTANVVNYVIPDGGHTEFIVLPSSVFTQTDGSVQFTASSNLVSVLVVSL